MLLSQARAIPTILFQRVGKAQSEVERKKKNSLQNERQERTREEEEKQEWTNGLMNLYVEVRIFPKETEGGNI